MTLLPPGPSLPRETKRGAVPAELIPDTKRAQCAFNSPRFVMTAVPGTYSVRLTLPLASILIHAAPLLRTQARISQRRLP